MMKRHLKRIGVLFASILIVSALGACGNSGQVNQISDSVGTEQANKVEDETGNKTNQVSDGNNGEQEEEESKVEFQTVNFGDTITTDFIEMSIVKASTSQELKPTDTSSVYSYFSDKDDETYFYITGDIKNIGGDSYSVEDMNIQLTFDDKYNYTGHIAADDGGNDFYGDYVKPFGKVKYYMYASVPDELIKSYSTCTIQFAFHDNCKSDYHSDFSLYEYCYEIVLTK